jgi:hypothetical protein
VGMGGGWPIRMEMRMMGEFYLNATVVTVLARVVSHISQ